MMEEWRYFEGSCRSRVACRQVSSRQSDIKLDLMADRIMLGCWQYGSEMGCTTN